MDAIDKKILNNYLGLLERLSPTMKLNLIDRLTKSVKSKASAKSKMKSAFGAWSSDESAEELIKRIQNSRKTNRQIEEL
tara:strand:+ start:305251 stop:305487 length:237 start_codon:yes stop_codon:yes gene_type:complete